VSSIRVQHGSAEVELEGVDVGTADGGALAYYQSEDLVTATLRALRAVDSTRSASLVAAIEAGLRSNGVDL
jgi:hypothetical protein